MCSLRGARRKRRNYHSWNFSFCGYFSFSMWAFVVFFATSAFGAFERNTFWRSLLPMANLLAALFYSSVGSMVQILVIISRYKFRSNLWVSLISDPYGEENTKWYTNNLFSMPNDSTVALKKVTMGLTRNAPLKRSTCSGSTGTLRQKKKCVVTRSS